MPAALEAQAPRQADAHVLVPGPARSSESAWAWSSSVSARSCMPSDTSVPAARRREPRTLSRCSATVGAWSTRTGSSRCDSAVDTADRARSSSASSMARRASSMCASAAKSVSPCSATSASSSSSQLVERGAGGDVAGVGGEDDARDQGLAQQQRPQARVARAGGRRAQDGLERGQAALRVGARDARGREGGGAGAADELGPRGRAGLPTRRCAGRASREHRHLRRPGTPVGSPDSDDRANGARREVDAAPIVGGHSPTCRGGACDPPR